MSRGAREGTPKRASRSIHGDRVFQNAIKHSRCCPEPMTGADRAASFQPALGGDEGRSRDSFPRCTCVGSEAKRHCPSMQTGVPCAQSRAMRLVRKGGCIFLGRLAPFLMDSHARSFLAPVPPRYTFMVPRSRTMTRSDGHAANKTSVPPPRGWSFYLPPSLPFPRGHCKRESRHMRVTTPCVLRDS